GRQGDCPRLGPPICRIAPETLARMGRPGRNPPDHVAAASTTRGPAHRPAQSPRHRHIAQPASAGRAKPCRFSNPTRPQLLRRTLSAITLAATLALASPAIAQTQGTAMPTPTTSGYAPVNGVEV